MKNYTIECCKETVGRFMDKELINILACPECKGDLRLQTIKLIDDDIITGSLFCPKCKVISPIENAIPCLLQVKLLNMISNSTINNIVMNDT